MALSTTYGTSGADSLYAPPGLSFALAGDDTLTGSNADLQVFIGGRGADYYIPPLFGPSLVAESSGSDGDLIYLNMTPDSPEFFWGTTGSAAFFLGRDLSTAVIVADWLAPDSRIETWVTSAGVFSFAEFQTQLAGSTGYLGDFPVGGLVLSTQYATPSQLADINALLPVIAGVARAVDSPLPADDAGATPATATVLNGTLVQVTQGIGGLADGTGSDEADMFAWSAPQDGLLSVSLSGLTGAASLALVDAGGTVLAGGATPSTATQNLTWYFPTYGTIYVRILPGATTTVEQIASRTYQLDLAFTRNPAPLGTPATDSLAGTLGPDAIDALASDDSVFGNDGADSLIGGPGQDTLAGGTGDDWFTVGDGADVVDGGTGADRVDFAVIGGSASVQNAETIAGGAGDDGLWLIDAPTASLDLAGGADRLTLVSSPLTASLANIETILAGTGADTLYLLGAASGVSVSGGAGSDLLYLGGGGNSAISVAEVETLVGSALSDGVRIDAAAGVVVNLLGGADGLTLADTPSSRVTGYFIETLQGGSGADFVQLVRALNGGVVDLAGGADYLQCDAAVNSVTIRGCETLAASGSADSLSLGDVQAGTLINLLGGIDALSLSDGANILTAMWVESLVGGTGADTITITKIPGGGMVLDGRGGADWVTLGVTGASSVANVETLAGSGTDDRVSLASAPSGALVNLLGGVDSLSLGDAGNNLTVMWAETIRGGAGADLLTLSRVSGGGVGLDGGAGGDAVLMSAAGSLTLTNVETITGSSGADSFFLTSPGGTLRGQGGADRINLATGGSETILFGDISDGGGFGATTGYDTLYNFEASRDAVLVTDQLYDRIDPSGAGFAFAGRIGGAVNLAADKAVTLLTAVGTGGLVQPGFTGLLNALGPVQNIVGAGHDLLLAATDRVDSALYVLSDLDNNGSFSGGEVALLGVLYGVDLLAGL